MMAQMKVHGISDKVMGLSSPRTMFFISLEPVKVFCQIWQTRFFKVQKDAAFQGLNWANTAGSCTYRPVVNIQPCIMQLFRLEVLGVWSQ